MPLFQVSQGWRFPANANLAKLCRELDTEGESLQLSMTEKAIARLARDVVDMRSIDNSKDYEYWGNALRFLTSGQVKPEGLKSHRNDLLSQCLDAVYETQLVLNRKYAQRVDLDLDHELKVVFYSDPGDPQWTYARVFSDHDELKDLWKRVSGAERFHWWWGQDPDNLPSGLTTSEWKQREAIWNRILGTEPQRPSGLVWRLSEDFYFNALMKEDMAPITKEGVAEAALKLTDMPMEYRQSLRQMLLDGLDGPAVKEIKSA